MMEQGFTLVMDIDGTICPIKIAGEDYANIVPYAQVVAKLRELRSEYGAYIVLHTSRQMRTYGGNVGKINAFTAPVLLNWLEKWDIPFDEIIYGKPWAGKHGVYVDDRAVRPDEFMRHTPEELEQICEAGRKRLEGKA